jgi:YVTN family beta-propeller protein
MFIPSTNGNRMFSWKLAGSAAGLLCALLICSSCGDTYRPVANPIVAPGGDPQPIHNAYVLFTNPNAPGGIPGNGTLEQVDVSGDSVTLDVIVGRNPLFASFLGPSTGAIYTANELDGSITQQSFFSVNPPSVITLPLGNTPVFIGGTQTTAVYIVDAATPQICPNGAVDVLATGNVITDTICVGTNPVALAQLPNGGKIYVINQGDSTVSVIDPTSKTVIAVIPVGSNPVWATSNLDGSYLFVVNKGSGSLTAIHTVDGTTTSIAVGTAPNFSIFDSRRNRLYVTNGGSNDVSVLDLSQATPATMLLKQHVALGTGATNPTSVVPLADGSRYYVANTGGNSVSVIEANSNTLAATAGPNPISLGTPASTTQPLWIESEPTSTKVYVTTPAPLGTPPANNPNGAPGVTIIRTSTNAISSFLQAPQTDPGCQVNPNANPPTTCTYQTPLQILTYVHD